MIVSNKYKIIFIHIYKNAGTFIRKIMKNLDPDCKEYGDPHIRAKSAKKLFGEKKYNEYTKFCVVRNSWDWQMSLFHYMKDTKNHYQYNIIKNFTVNDYLNWRLTDLHDQLEFILDDNNKPLIPNIIRFENLNNEIIAFFHKQGINILKFIPKNRMNSSRRDRNYRVYYDNYGKKMVANMHKKDIKYFNFQF